MESERIAQLEARLNQLELLVRLLYDLKKSKIDINDLPIFGLDLAKFTAFEKDSLYAPI